MLRLVAQGLGDAEIAERLVLSPHTVHRHVANVRTKLRLPSRTAAVAYAARAGLLSVGLRGASTSGRARGERARLADRARGPSPMQ